MTSPRAMACSGLLALMGAAVRNAHAQIPADVEMPQAFQLYPGATYVEANIEAERAVSSAGVPSVSLTQQRLLIQPVLGLGINGSIYHPNLVAISLATELGLDWQGSQLVPGGSGSDANFLQRYHGELDLVRQQPYSTSFFADKDQTYRDYDFFSRVRVDTERYGGRTGYSAGPVPFSLTFQHYDEVTDDIFRPARLAEDTVAFSAQNLRDTAAGNTQLTYNFDSFQRQDDGFSNQRGLSQILSLFDTESFGREGWAHLNSLLNYSSLAETVLPTDMLLVHENLQLQHSPRLNSFYEYNFDTTSAGQADATTQQGRAGLTHQLYENLTTTLDLHGYQISASSPGNSLESSRFGTALGLQYVRNLSQWGNLTAGYAGTIDREDRSASGQSLSIIDEVHTLTDGSITFLNQPSVDISTIHVVASSHTMVYLPHIDYLVTSRGLMTEIQRLPGGKIPNGGKVLVSYSAVVEASAGFSSFDNSFNFRIDFWNGLVGVYGRWTKLDYSGGEQLHLRSLDDKIVGVDTTLGWLRAGAEHEVSDSNLAGYERDRLFESLLFSSVFGGNFGVDFDQNWTTYYDNQSQESSYGFLLHYDSVLAPNLSFNCEGGVQIQRGTTFDRNLAVARAGLDWTMGKLIVKLGYEYNLESHIYDSRERNYLFVRVRRNF